MKFAITADLHFDAYPSLSSILDDGTPSRLRDCADCFLWICAEAKKVKCDGLFVLGDVFDSRTDLDIRVLNTFANCLRGAGMPVTIISGNHDSYLRDSSVTSVSALSGLAQVITSPTVQNYGATPIFFVPWTDDEDEFSATLRSAKVSGNTVLVSHCLVEGIYSGHGFGVGSLHADRFRRIFLGDVHDSQPVCKNGMYVGAPMQFDFGDSGRKRGFVIYDTATGLTQFVENKVSPQFHVYGGKVSLAAPVKRGDFARVDGSTPVGFSDTLRKSGVHVEAVAVTPPGGVRVAVGNSNEEELIRKYVEWKMGNPKSPQSVAAVRIGMSILSGAEA